MSLFWIFTSREEKNTVLLQIISKLHISEEEKELYKLSLEILDDENFWIFYEKMKSQFKQETITIAPFTSQLI